MSNKTAVIPQVAEYFGHNDFPYITQTFTPGRGWVNVQGRWRVSRSKLRRMKREGITHVQLTGVKKTSYGQEHVHPDFSVEELLRRDERPLLTGNLIGSAVVA